MSERYTKVRTLPQNLYAEDSPLIIRNAVLLEDNIRGGFLAQMKFENIDPRSIRTVTVSAQALGENNAPVGEPVLYTYEGTIRDLPFGQDKAFRLPGEKCCSYAPSVTEVTFSDDTIWQAEPSQWTPLEDPQCPDTDIWDAGLREQYRLERGCELCRTFQETRGLWYCGCGALNRSSEEICHCCGQSLEVQRKEDPQSMRERLEARRREEALAAEQLEQEKIAREAAMRRNRRLNTAIIGIILVASVSVYFLWKPEFTYRRGLAAMKDQDWETAAQCFDDCDLRNSKSLYDTCLEHLQKQDREFLEAFRQSADAEFQIIQDLTGGSLDAQQAANRIGEELEDLEQFRDADFYDEDLTEWLRKYCICLIQKETAFAEFDNDVEFNLTFNRAHADCSDIFWAIQDKYEIITADSPVTEYFPRDTDHLRASLDTLEAIDSDIMRQIGTIVTREDRSAPMVSYQSHMNVPFDLTVTGIYRNHSGYATDVGTLFSGRVSPGSVIEFPVISQPSWDTCTLSWNISNY